MTRFIHHTAYRHDVTDEHITHAIEHAIVVADIDQDLVLYIGPDLAANLLEVIAVIEESGDELVIHAMALRRAFRFLLRRLEAQDE